MLLHVFWEGNPTPKRLEEHLWQHRASYGKSAAGAGNCCKQFFLASDNVGGLPSTPSYTGAMSFSHPQASKYLPANSERNST